MGAQADALAAGFEAARRQAVEIVGSLSEAQFAQRPTPKSWCIGECLGHLNQSARAYLPLLEDAIEAARVAGWEGGEPYRHGFLGKWIVSSMEPPVRLRLPSPGAFTPIDFPDQTECLGRFSLYQDEYLKRIREGKGLDWSRIRIRSPISRLVRFNLLTALAFLGAHQRRHLWQAAQVRETILGRVTAVPDPD